MTEKQSALDLLLEEVDLGDGLEQPTPAEDQQDETNDTEPEQEPESAPLNETEDVEIDGLNVVYTTGEDGELEAQLPDEYANMSEEQKVAFDRKVDDGSKTLAKLKQERMQQKDKDRRIQELEDELAKTRQPEAKLDEGGKTETTVATTDLKKYWGVETWAELADLQVDNPEAYHQGFAKQAEDAAVKAQQKAVADQKVHNAILAEGYNYAEVKEFADKNGIQSLSVALDYYKLKNPKAKAPLVRKIPPSAIPAKSTPTTRPVKKSYDDEVNDILISGAKKL